MKLFVDFWYCFIDAWTDLQKMIYQNRYQKRFGSDWEKPFLDFLMSEATKKFSLSTSAFWLYSFSDLFIMTSCLADAYLFHHDVDKALWAGFVVSIIIALPIYLWWRKNIDNIINNYRYDLKKSHFSIIKKIMAWITLVILTLSPLLVLVIFAPLTSQ